MSCKHCHDYCLVQTIHQEQDLDFALATIRDGIAGGTLHESFEVRDERHPRVSLEQILEHGPVRQRAELTFVCAFCGERFMLTVRTEPQFEGEWAPVHSGSRRSRQ